jgi:hypothetical protein
MQRDERRRLAAIVAGDSAGLPEILDATSGSAFRRCDARRSASRTGHHTFDMTIIEHTEQVRQLVRDLIDQAGSVL